MSESAASEQPKLWEGRNKTQFFVPKDPTAHAKESKPWEGRNRSRLFPPDPDRPKDPADSRADRMASVVVFVCLFLMVLMWMGD